MEQVYGSMSGHAEHEASFILDRVDGLSDYGFGDDIDLGDLSDECSEPSEKSDLTALPRRRVHFGTEVEHMNVHGQSTSPSLTRALLPSAQPLDGECHIYALQTEQLTLNPEGSMVGHADTSDSDATEVSSRIPSPSQENTTSETPLGSSTIEFATPVNTRRTMSTRKCKTRSSRRRKGPPRGIFNVDQDKSWAILDSTGKKILQIPAASTNRHAWLDEMSHATSTPSVSASPLNSSMSLNQRSVSAPVTKSANRGLTIDTDPPDDMMAGLGAKMPFTESEPAHALGPPEAFFSSGLHLVGGDYAVSPEADSDAFEDATPASKKARFPLGEFLEDFDDDDEFEDDDSALPLFAPADDNLTADDDGLYSHLNNINVTAFRRSADPMSVSRPGTAQSFELQPSPIAGPSFELSSTSTKMPRTSHKRKASSTPYQDEKIYGDVTPVERKVLRVPKRRKIST